VDCNKRYAMKLNDLKILIGEGEGFELEFKRKVSTPIKVAKTLMSFANTKGGIVLFGVDDDRTIIGVGSEKEQIEMIQLAASYYCDPPLELDIDTVPYKGRDVVVVTIEESDQKPHYLNVDESEEDGGTRAYIRVNDKTVEASKEVVHILQAENPSSPPLRIAIGENERHMFDFLDENERITVKQYSKLVNVSHRRASRTLIQLVRAGVLRIHTHEKEDFYTRAF
jgi:predicted HTH transcriptional regulator